MKLSEFIAERPELTCSIQIAAIHVLEPPNKPGDAPWTHDVWSCSFTRFRTTEIWEFRTGSGARKDKGYRDGGLSFSVPFKNELERQSDGSYTFKVPTQPKERLWIVQGHHRWELVKPTMAEVLHCLAMDAGALQETFEEWCINLGYSTDSQRASRIYQVCLDTATRLTRIVGLRGLADLIEAEED